MTFLGIQPSEELEKKYLEIKIKRYFKRKKLIIKISQHLSIKMNYY